MYLLLTAVFLPLLCGILVMLLPLSAKSRNILVSLVLMAELVVTAALALSDQVCITVLSITSELVLSFRTDSISAVFSLIAAGLFLPVGIYSFRYLTHEGRDAQFLGCFLLVLGALTGMDYAANLVSMYIFYELVTLTALPLVLHNRSRRAIRASLKYLFYSIAGAFLALLGILCISRFTTLDFVPGGTLSSVDLGNHRTLVMALLFCAVLGFGAKAGLFPLHGWLPAAHPVAPGPASAVLSAVIAKSGVLAIIRLIYFVAGPSMLRGTWVQTTWLFLAMGTIFMGSMMAWHEKTFKRRLAFSTVSQISYILCGLFLLTQEGLQGALLHTLFHAAAKTGLFLTAGAIIFHTGKTNTDQFQGIGLVLPRTMGAYTLVALSLVGIPPFAGFVSKWQLAAASLDSGLPVISWLYPVVLLVSALLTAAYLLPVTIDGFFPEKDIAVGPRLQEFPSMWIPLAVLGAAALCMGICGGWLMEIMAAATAGLA